MQFWAYVTSFVFLFNSCAVKFMNFAICFIYMAKSDYLHLHAFTGGICLTNSL